MTPEEKKRENTPERLKYKRDWFLDNREASMLNRARHRAKNNQIEFNISVSDVIIPKTCPILGIELKYGKDKSSLKESPSLDRIDSTKGYIRGNVWVISNLANRMKNDATKDELISFAKGILNLYGTK